jgi:hypothetical protein
MTACINLRVARAALMMRRAAAARHSVAAAAHACHQPLQL